MDQVVVLAQQVRQVVRDRRIDPRTDAEAVRGAAREVVARHEAASLTGQVPSLDDPEVVIGQLVADVAGLGPLQRFLDDDAVEEIWVNAPDRIFVARDGRHELTAVRLTTEQVRELIERMLSSTGRRLDLSQPFVDAMLPGGHRLHVVLDGITLEHPAVNIRKFVAKASTLDDLVALGTLDTDLATMLRQAVADGRNIVVAGGTQAGKTTMINCLAGAIPGTQRLITVEEVFELQCGHPDWVALQTRQAGLEGTGEITLRMLVKEALRMRPNRLIVGEVRAGEALDMLLALNSGLPGMATVHANSAQQALAKLCTLPLLAADNIAAAFVVPTVATCVDLVVHTAIEADGLRAVQEVVEVTGRAEGDVIETETVFRRHAPQERVWVH